MNDRREVDPDREEALFAQALPLDPTTRSAFLQGACDGDDNLRTAVEELLAAADRAERSPGWKLPALQNEAGAISASGVLAGFVPAELEGYEILERLGAGGMGVVYRAVRKDRQFSKTVAVKIVHAGEPALFQRFYQERQIIASLEHPNIARLLDVGATPEGTPFLVMEFVDGVPIDKYVSDQGPSQRELLQLFCKICSAVSHAHRNLIVHRDLKPANILVTAQGEPKLLDFGIAKLIDEDSLRTLTGAAVMTPEYASPEQINGSVITTASDVYSLGVLLYHILSGRRPYRKTTGPAELANAITSAPPEPLERVDPDLAIIVNMALRKEPDRRYSSVEQFSEDVRRFMDGYPIAARPDDRRYRVSKFVRRNRVVLSAAVLVGIAIAGGVAATLREARIADRRFNDVRKLANSYVFEIYDGLRDLPGATSLRQLVVKRALEYLDSLSQERGNDVGLGRELASAYVRVGRVQGEPSLPNLGDPKGALASYRKALEIRLRLQRAAPANVEIGVELAEVYELLANLLDFQANVSGAADNLRKALAVSEGLLKSNPQDYRVRKMLASNYIILGNVTGNSDVHNLGDWRGALNFYEKARPVLEGIATENPSDRMNRLTLATLYGKLSNLARLRKEDKVSAEWFVRAVAIGEALTREEPGNALYRHQLAVDGRSLCLVYLALGRVDEARNAGDQSNGVFERLVRDDANNMQAREELADSTYSQGFVLEKAGNPDGAFERYGASIALYEKLKNDRPGTLPAGIRTAYQLTGGLAARLGDVPRAMAAVRQQLSIDDQLLKASPGDASAKLNRGVAFLQIGRAYEVTALKNGSQADWRQSLNWDQRSLDVWLQCRKEGILNPGYATFQDRAEKAIEKCKAALNGKR